MKNYIEVKNRLIDIVAQLIHLFALPKELPGLGDAPFPEWNEACERVRRQLADDLLRVAVVGTIKSGKSTFINALLAGDYLKRGAGVITSIVTRVRYGESLKATLFFKSWDEVNRDMEGALTLLPDYSFSKADSRFDIRRSADREALREALSFLSPEQLITQDARNVNGVLLYSYLKGYDRVAAFIQSEPVTRVFDENEFDAHRSFVGDDSLSVYLSDIELEIASSYLSDSIEIADCQGSDSPNPLHLAMIQDYLNMAHLIVYVISSRTGLRQADIRFLSMIKKMGILDNALFIVNCDFSEHGSVEDLSLVVDKTTEELSLIKPTPRIFTLSALFNLFRLIPERLLEKDNLRYSHWLTETGLTRFSDDNFAAFETVFEEKLITERHAVLLHNHIERIERMLAGIAHWQAVNREIMTQGTQSGSLIASRIEEFKSRMLQIQAMVSSAIDGAVGKIQREAKANLDHFFGDRGSGITATILHFIRSYDMGVEKYASDLTQRGFNATVYQVFQDFKQALDTFLAQSINPLILGLVREQETKIEQDFKLVSSPFDVMIHEAISEFSGNLAKIGIPPMEDLSARADAGDLETVKGIAGIKLPPIAVTLRYSAKIQTEAVARLGLYAALTFMKQLMKKPFQNEIEKKMSALSDGIRRMRHETEKTILSHLLDYRENLKFQYMIKLIDAMAAETKGRLLNRFQSYTDSLIRMLSLIDTKQVDKEKAHALLDEMAAGTVTIREGLKELRRDIGLA